MEVLFNTKISDEHLERVRAGFPDLTVHRAESIDEAEALIANCEVLVTWWSNFVPDLLQAPKLKWVHSLAAGVDGFFLPPIKSGEVLLTNSSGIHGLPMAEHVMAIMLAFSRGIFRYARQQKERRWERLRLSELNGKTLGVIGMGSIGQEIAQHGAAFGMRVLGVKRNPGQQYPGVDRMVSMEGLDMVLKESDYVVLSVPLTPETDKMIGRRELELMKPDSILINVARGEVIDEAALIEALRENIIGGAGLDVFETEPLPESSPLWELENCLITPHCAALSPQYMARAVDLFCRNLEAYRNGQPMPNLVDPVRGY